MCSFEGANEIFYTVIQKSLRHAAFCVILIQYSSLAQLVERAAVNRVVAGSSPAGGAENPQDHKKVLRIFVFHGRVFLEPERRMCLKTQ